VVVISSSQVAVKASQNFELQISFGLAQVKVSRESNQTKKTTNDGVKRKDLQNPQTLSLL
jgi:hypothetical protein